VYERILVPLDGSEASEASLPVAGSLASRLGSELVLLRVIEPLPIVPSSRLPSELDAGSQTYLERAAEPLLRAQVRVRTLVARGDPADQILERARGLRVDLIVVGIPVARGRRGRHRRPVLDRLLQSTVPVLVVARA
jgi:nucleotide-binding universal stress UspA family protein